MKRKLMPFMLVGSIVLVGCTGESEPTPTVTVTETVTATPETTVDAEETADPEEPADYETSSRGARIMNAGDGDTLTTAEGDELFTFKVTTVEVDPSCTAPNSNSAEHGHFVVFDAQLEVFVDDPMYGMPTNIFNSAAYRVVDKDGTTRNESPNTGPAHSCFPDSEVLNMSIGAGEKSTGKVVFDVPLESGILLTEYESTGLKWEWAY